MSLAFPNSFSPKIGVSLTSTLGDGRMVGAQDIRITACCSDSRRCQAGDLFVAKLGTVADGHDFAQDAVQRGASAILAERILPLDVPQYIVDDTRVAHGEICHALAGNPADSLRVIGVTGSHGKTTTQMLLAGILEAAQQQLGILGSLGYCDGVNTKSTRQTTPAPTELSRWLARMAGNGCEHAIVEVSSKALVERHLSGLQLDVALFTNIQREHAELHGSVRNYRNAKARMLNYLKPNGFVVMNADDRASTELMSKVDAPLITFGMHGDAELTGTLLERHSSEQTFLLEAGDDSIPVRTTTIGDQHIYNCLAAAATGLVMGFDLHTVVRGLESVDFVPRRLERVECGQEFNVYVDQTNSPESLAQALKTLRQVTGQQLICVFAADDNQSTADRQRLGRVVERYADRGIITNSSHKQQSHHVAHDILDGYERPAGAHLMPSRGKAICWALGEAQPGDTVLIAGNQSQSVPHESNQIDGASQAETAAQTIDDAEIARYWLYEVGADKTSPWSPV